MDPMKLRADLEQASMLIVALEKVTFNNADNRARLEQKLYQLLMQDYYDNFSKSGIINEQL